MQFHDPYSCAFRTPGGAVKTGESLTLSVLPRERNEAGYTLLMKENGGEPFEKPMNRAGDRFTASLPAPEKTGLYYYAFRGESSGAVYTDGGKWWPLTVYDKDFETPAWFCDSVCCQIFPDRFFRSAETDTYAAAEYHRSMGRRVFLHENWDEAPCHLPREGEAEYAPEDYFGGSLKGIEEKLSYLKELGVSSVYRNPVFEADSNHRYNTADYLKIDPLLGTEEDFASLARRAREAGIRLILDGVFSHTGADSRYFDKKGTYGGGAYGDRNSPYRSWYRFTEWPDKYESWWGFKTLPEVEETEEGYGRFIHGENGVLHHWMERGASGWRLDVADELPDPFIRDIRTRVKAEDPEGVLLGEVWEDCSDKEGPCGRRAYVDGAELDGSMNYPFRRAVLQFLNGETEAKALEESLLSLYGHYPRPFYEACLNLISSHDETRALSYLAGAPSRYMSTREEQAAFEPSPAALARAKKLFAAATALQMALPGVPCVYYGDEAGLDGIGDPFNRKPYPWGGEDKELLSRVKKLIALRNGVPALKKEALMRIGAVTKTVFSVYRENGESAALLLVNRGETDASVCYYPALAPRGADGLAPVSFSGVYRDAFTGKAFTARNTLSARVPACGFLFLVRE